MIKGTGIEPKTYKDRLADSRIVKIEEHRTLFIPENLEIDELLRTNPFGTHRKKLHHQELREWILLFVAFFHRKSIQLRLAEVDSIKLKSIYDNYAEITSWLEHVRVLYIQNHSAGNRYRSYRVRSRYTGGQSVSIFMGKIIQKADELCARDVPDERTAYLRPFFSDLTIRNQGLDLSYRKKEKNAEFMKRYRGNEVLAKSRLDSWWLTIRNRIALSRYSINSRRFDFIPDPNTTRLYTTVSMMVRKLRSLLEYKGEALHEVDMSCAMPISSHRFVVS
jgi:hypothetical protein